MPTVLVVNRTRANAEALASSFSGRQAQLAILAANSSEARSVARSFAPDVALLELDVTVGVKLVRELVREHRTLHVFIYGSTGDQREVRAWADAGATRIVTRTVPLTDLVQSVCEAAFLGAPVDKTRTILHHASGCTSLIRERPAGLVDLTQRERDVLQLIAVGLSNREVADTLSLELPTVKNHVQHLMRKLGVHRRADAAQYWHDAYATGVAG